ncbi:thioredoxin domain-containing protein [Tichowtungia aerotolerans]|uniref:DUF255 domain-containing protein n=1 Tax=Tichowtungia aerotolerans TaxID=2697043 RepID=A0A6P1MDM8_9BACT|nr:thioredoxin domain-containing protein [Tichowtungia aerotolerans]QHI69696.1 DUF255 domain-containing protein [Tichowtungia aerotolerans]
MPKQTNQLIHEKSPYLLQHAHNPVDWFPWGDEAFRKAREEDKPVFLSIGYATCHWCHVMAHESFENPEAAAALNEAFVCVKVDREERPDIDEIYMTVCQMLTRSGGWPLTVVMTPEKQPFFAGTYIPLESRFGRTGLLELVPRLSDAWKNQRETVVKSAAELTAALAAPEEGATVLDEDLLERTFEDSEETFDGQHGGFGSAPKFPSPHRLVFLIRQNPEAARPMVDKTLTAMHRGGVWDQIGFGMHRYSTDREWLVPHFEKMLYDQALTALACIEAFEAYGDEPYRRMAEEIFEYVLRDMTAPEGGFYSAEDADSEGIEGKFYVWSLDELRELLDSDELAMVVKIFHVQADGNFRDESSRRKTGDNILHRSGPENVSEEIRSKLFAAREKRIHPLKDTKVLADWNGLMIAALAKAGRVFDDPQYAEAAQRAADFVWSELQDNGRLTHRWREGQAAVPGQLTDYAFMIFGLLELYETSFDFQTLEKALTLNDAVLAQFRDPRSGGFYLTADDAEPLIVRPKSILDGALPSGNSIQVMNLLKLARMTGRIEFEKTAARTARAFASTINRIPSAFTQALQAIQFVKSGGIDVVIVGDRGLPATQALIQAVRSARQPNCTVLLKTPGLETIAPFTADMRPVNGAPAVYICRSFACERPFTDPEAVRDAMSEMHQQTV